MIALLYVVSIEDTDLFNHFKWVWSGIRKVIESSELAISQN